MRVLVQPGFRSRPVGAVRQRTEVIKHGLCSVGRNLEDRSTAVILPSRQARICSSNESRAIKIASRVHDQSTVGSFPVSAILGRTEQMKHALLAFLCQFEYCAAAFAVAPEIDDRGSIKTAVHVPNQSAVRFFAVGAMAGSLRTEIVEHDLCAAWMHLEDGSAAVSAAFECGAVKIPLTVCN